MPRSRAAIDRLEQAVHRLEGVMGRPRGDLFGHADLSTSAGDYADETTRVVESRLDAVIDRLKTILED
ncbi:hypothetical protein CWS72_07645 [Telmatospirillum siberiense]|uniref:Uncharacterized protein n=1 Tax=Telmatospirillum siberiense TaxID=382514 RepID=A0A2N3PXS5_9PROT|nr:hypothetical protein CWS72_07645 [Telmatospirillum siberiense]